MLVGLGFAKCYNNDIIIFILTPRNHVQEVFERFEEHNFKLHPSKCHYCFDICLENLKHMIYLKGLKVQKVKVETIS
jgi:hypothetical protein